MTDRSGANTPTTPPASPPSGSPTHDSQDETPSARGAPAIPDTPPLETPTPAGDRGDDGDVEPFETTTDGRVFAPLVFNTHALHEVLQNGPDETRSADATRAKLEQAFRDILGGSGAIDGAAMTPSEEALVATLVRASHDLSASLPGDEDLAKLVLLPTGPAPANSAPPVTGSSPSATGSSSPFQLPGSGSVLPAPPSSLEQALGDVGVVLRLGSEVKCTYGASSFLERADRTARALVGATRLVHALANLAGFRELQGDLPAGTRPAGAGDLILMGLAHTHDALSRSRQLARELEDARRKLAEARADAAQLTGQLVAAKLSARRYMDRLEPSEHELEDVRLKLKNLRDDLDASHKRNRILTEVNRALREKVREADKEHGEVHLKKLYEFLFTNGRVVPAQADQLYRLLRAAVVGDAGAVPDGTWLTIATMQDDRPHVSPPVMEELPGYQPLDETAPDASSAGKVPTILTPVRAASTEDIQPPVPTASESGSSKKRRAALISSDSAVARRIDGREKKRAIQEALLDVIDVRSGLVDLSEELDDERADASGDEEDAASVALASLREKAVKLGIQASLADKQLSLMKSQTGKSAAPAKSSPVSKKFKSLPAPKPVARPAARAPNQSPILHRMSADALKQCVAVPRRLKSAPVTQREFPAASLPFTLGTALGYSSTVDYSDATVRQLDHVAGLSTQMLAPPQSCFFPNYELVKNKSRAHMLHFGHNPGDQVETILQAAPWDEMWAQRARHIFLFNPNKFSARQVAYFERVWVFMYRFRREYWTRTHWLAISRNHCGSQLQKYYDQRQADDAVFLHAWKKLRDNVPAGLTLLIWSEPAFWYVPERPCSWIVGPVTQKPILDQLAELDELEPIRANWSTHPHRFVEALLPKQLALLDEHDSQCWELPAPWNDADYEPPATATWEPPAPAGI